MKYPYFLAILVLVVLLSGCATTSGPVAGTINGYPIPLDQFYVAQRGHYDNFYIINKRAPGVEENNEIIRQTWKDITTHVILQDQFRKFGITSSRQEALDTLEVNPPNYIKTSPLFQKDGHYERAQFIQALKYEPTEEIEALIRQYRDYYVPIAKLKQILIQKQLLNSKDKDLILKALNSSVDLELLVIDPSAKEVAVKDEDIRFYYDSNPDKFLLEPQYSVAYTYLKLEPSAQDIADSQAFADSLYKQLLQAEDPEVILKSQTAKERQINLISSGFLKISELDHNLLDKLLKLSAGDYLEPIADEGFTLIYRLEQITKTLISYTILKVPYLPGSQTIAHDKARALQNVKLISAMGYQVAQEELDLEFMLRENIPWNSHWLDDPSNPTTIKEMGKNLRKGYVPEPVFNNAQSAWLLMQVTDVQSLTRKPLAEVSTDISHIVAQEKAYEYALKDAQNSLKDSSFQALSSQKGVSLDKLQSQSINHIQSNLLDADMLFSCIWANLKNQKPQIFEKEGLIIIPIIQNIKVQKDKVEPQVLQSYFEKTLADNWFEAWMEVQVKAAKIIYKK